MKFVYFPPGRKQFLFSKSLLNKKSEQYLLYIPYTTFSKIIWNFFLKFKFTHSFFIYNESSLPIKIQTILSVLASEQVDFQINNGTKGPDQKITLIKYENLKTTFFKISDTIRGSELIFKEFNTLKNLKGNFGAPKALNWFSEKGFQFLETEYVHAKKMTSYILNDVIFFYILSISMHRINKKEQQLTCFNHGDCCPWNFLQPNKNVVLLIDWELADEYILGYDLFTFIFQTHFLLEPKKSNNNILEDNTIWIKRFFDHFGVEDIKLYLNCFITIKLDYETKKNKDSQLTNKYIQLKKDLPNLKL